jgi:hypothetical protein
MMKMCNMGQYNTNKTCENGEGGERVFPINPPYYILCGATDFNTQLRKILT